MSEKLEAAEADRRNAMRHYDQMRDAEKLCVPCKLCGGAAEISDAGTGAGYYVKCSNSTTWRDSTGCLINERRLGGWAYNVMDWWNRLHAATPANGEQVDPATVERCAQVADTEISLIFSTTVDGRGSGVARRIRDKIRTLATLPTPTQDARERVKFLERQLAACKCGARHD